MKLSIITINRNNAEGLRKTIESVVSQTYTDFEYIIIDGASTDDSVDIIKEYADRITYWVSEPDTGIYNAMNKGILKANGEYLLFLNSGDLLCEKRTIENVYDKLNTYQILFGYVVDDKGKVKDVPQEFSLRYLYYNNISHQAEFIKRDLFDRLGLYDESFKILADYKFNISALMGTINVFYLNQCIAVVDNYGISNVNESQHLINIERDLIFKLLIPHGIMLDYKYWLNPRTFSNKSIVWLINNEKMFKVVRLIHKYFGNDYK